MSVRRRWLAAQLGLCVAGPGAATAEEWYELDPTLYDNGTDYRVYEDIDLPPDPVGLPPIQWDLRDGGFVQFYGHINAGLLQYRDGRETRSYFPLDNANSPARVGLRVYRPLEDGSNFGFRFELGYSPFSSFRANQLDDEIDWNINRDNIRWLQVSYSKDNLGDFAFGQGSMATDGITLIDFSATNVIAYSSVGDSAGGQYLRFTDPSLPIEDAPRIRQAFFGLNGPRRFRVRYDTPVVNGLGASIAYGRQSLTENAELRDQDQFDSAITYGDTLGDYRVGAGAGYFWDQNDREVYSGSASVLHQVIGVNVTVAAGQLDSGSRTAGFLYGKLGYLRDFTGLGDSAFSIDYYLGNDIVVDGSDSGSWGLAYVQFIDRANTELWLTLRRYDFDEPDQNFKDGEAVYAGLRFRW